MVINFQQLDLQLQDESGGDISSFITNGEWDLLGEFLQLLSGFVSSLKGSSTAISNSKIPRQVPGHKGARDQSFS